MTASEQTGDALLTADMNRRLFDGIAGRYDLMNVLMSFGMDCAWRRRAVTALAPVAGGRYLDVGCGTGALCDALLRREPGASVAGIDPSSAMLDRARRRLARAVARGQAEFVAGDAAAAPYPAAAFDGVISGFCIRNLTDRRGAFAEMRRVVRPGGRIVALELTRPAGRVLRLAHALHCTVVIPAIGRLLARGAAYRYLAASVAHFPPAARIRDELAVAGLIDVTARPLTGGIVTVFSARRPEAGAATGAPDAAPGACPDGAGCGESPLVFATAPYLNAAPLTEGLRETRAARVRHAVPSRLAELVLHGDADIGLVPVVDYLFTPELSMVEGIGVCADGPVRSVLLCSRRPWAEVGAVAADPASHTSNLLAQLVLRDQLGSAAAVGVARAQGGGDCDAEVVIGDRALARPVGSELVLDLGEQWKRMTGLPFVFAVWAYRTANPRAAELIVRTHESLRVGSGVLSSIAARYAEPLGLPVDACMDYLTQRIRYHVGEPERRAMARFGSRIAALTGKPCREVRT